jgi:GntR family transcriptional repressor for pyruvate dehydrogenase complex
MDRDRPDDLVWNQPSDRQSDAIFGPVVSKNVSSLLADRIRSAILDGRLTEGTVMPTERELVEQTGLGRSTVREALGLLQAEGLVSAGRGSKGGRIVQLPRVDDVVQSLGVFIRGRRLSFSSLLTTREALEPTCASLAARERTDADLELLTSLHERMSAPDISQKDFSAANARWHIAIAQASRNELLSAFMEAIGRAIEFGMSRSSDFSQQVRPQVLHAHDRILEAIRNGESDLAMRRMLKHVHAYTVQIGEWQIGGDLPIDAPGD